MTEPISIMLPYDNRPKTVTVSVELSDAYVALLRAADYLNTGFELTRGSTSLSIRKLLEAREQVLRAGGGNDQ
jgi:hypothetical protein